MVLLRNSDLKTTLLPDGYAVVFSPVTNWAYTLHPMAAAVWEFCDGKHSKDSLINQLSGLLESIDAAEASRRIGSIIDELIDAGLVTHE